MATTTLSTVSANEEEKCLVKSGKDKRLEGRFPTQEGEAFPCQEEEEGNSVLREKCQMSHVKSKQMEMCNTPYSFYYILIILYYYIYIIYI